VFLIINFSKDFNLAKQYVKTILAREKHAKKDSLGWYKQIKGGLW